MYLQDLKRSRDEVDEIEQVVDALHASTLNKTRISNDTLVKATDFKKSVQTVNLQRLQGIIIIINYKYFIDTCIFDTKL